MIFLFTKNSYENQKLYDAAIQQDILLVCNADDIFWRFGHHEAGFIKGVSFNKMNIGLKNNYIVRSLTNSKSIVGKYMSLCGFIGDPSERFTTERIPKMHSELIRHFSFEKNKSISYFAFNYDTLIKHKNLIEYPVVYKPVIGAHGDGMELINNEDDMLRKARHHSFSESSPIFLQQFLYLIEEYRVILFNHRLVNSASKVMDDRKLFSGRRFNKVELPDIIRDYAIAHSKYGLVGMDIGLTRDGLVFILEQNRAPEFEHIDKATGLNTAELIIKEMIGV